MERMYAEICESHGCTAKVFTKENGSLRKKMGTPDLLILFTDTVSHKMVISASKEAKRCGIPIARHHSSSAAAPPQRIPPVIPSRPPRYRSMTTSAPELRP